MYANDNGIGSGRRTAIAGGNCFLFSLGEQ